MRCAVVKASKGYHRFKITIYIYMRIKPPSIYHSKPSVTSKTNQVHPYYFSKITLNLSIKFHINKLHHPTFNPCFPYYNLIHNFLKSNFLGLRTCTILVLFSCHPGGTTLEPYMYSKWVDTVPLSNTRGQFPSLVTPWEGNPNLSPIRKGAVSVSNQKTAGHSPQSVNHWSQSPIC